MKSLEALIIRTATETDATIKIDASKIARAGLALAKKHGITPSDAVSHVMIGTWKGIASYEAGDATIETWIRTRILGEISHSTDRTKSRKVLSQASELAMTGASEDEATRLRTTGPRGLTPSRRPSGSRVCPSSRRS